jgi:N-acetylglucosaminyldiphosphoundecaprenol N-acetyl-beta-D-mannosaminyltransferase
MFLLKDVTILKNKKALRDLPKGKLLINTINAHSYNTALKDNFFSEASSETLYSFGISVRKSGGNNLLIR